MNNYHIPPQHIYNLAADVLEELSKEGKLKIRNLKMHRLFVPDVELVKRQYDLQKALNVDLPLIDENNIEYFKKIGEYFLNKENEVENKNKELQNLKAQIQNLNSNILSLQNENKSLKENLLSPQDKKQSLKLSLLEEKVKTKVLKNKILETDLELKSKDIKENVFLKEDIKRLEQDLIYIKHSSLNIYTSAKLRVQNHLAYKLGQALILNSKSILEIIEKYQMGFCIIVSDRNFFEGVITSGDIRRFLLKNIDTVNKEITERILNNDAVVAKDTWNVREFLEHIRSTEKNLNFVPVLDSANTLVGAVSFEKLVKGEL